MPAIPIHRGRGKAARVVAHTIVDAQDFEALRGRIWRLHDGYAVTWETTTGVTRMVSLHRELLGLSPGDPREGDHIDLDRLNNQRSNLRIVTKAQNLQNKSAYRTSRHGRRTSRHRGVCWDKAKQKWHAYASIDRHMHHLGHYEAEEDAARAASDFRAQRMPYATF